MQENTDTKQKMKKILHGENEWYNNIETIKKK